MTTLTTLARYVNPTDSSQHDRSIRRNKCQLHAFPPVLLEQIRSQDTSLCHRQVDASKYEAQQNYIVALQEP